MIVALIALKPVFIKYIINIYCAGSAPSLVAGLGHELSQVENQQDVVCNQKYVVVLGSKMKEQIHALPLGSWGGALTSISGCLSFVPQILLIG